MNIYFLTLALVSVAFASDVLEFTDDDFDIKVPPHDVILIEFFAPWCGHCKKLAPEYEKAATILKKNDPPVSIAKIDCTAHTVVCGKHGVSGYPTLKIFRKGEFAEDYNGARDASGIVRVMKSKAGPTSKNCESVEALKKFLAVDEYGVVGFFKSNDDDLAKAFMKTTDTMTADMRFAHTTNKDVAKEYKYKDTVVLYRPTKFQSKFEEKVMKYEGAATEQKLKTWVQENSLGLCGHRTQENADKFKSPLFVAYYDVDYVKNPKGTNYWRNRVMKVGKKLVEAGKDVHFAISSKMDMSNELSEFGLDSMSGDKPVVCAKDARDRKFKMEDEFSMDAFEKFVNDVLDGKLEPYMKSEPIPDNTDEAVKTVVAKNFEELVNNNDKDVLIEFYAPWCGHCKSLAPKFEELAKLMEDEPEITIAKMDATANDVAKPYEVSGFPTLYFARKNKKDAPVKYSGGREVDDFVQYLAKESTNELKGYNRKGKKVKSKKSEL